MALNQIPVLPESYPLFDWADYQSSRDALVQGTPTVQCAKAAWNALVDDLSDALAEAGLEWDETYTTAEGARMTDADGQLTAAKFNSVRLNIDHPAPLGWAWERKPDFRGYLGRVEMRGAATHRRRCDVVYPEYIIELARKLNVLLEIMRGTALLADVECGLLLGVVQEIELRSQPSAPVEVEHISATQVQPDILCRPAAHIETDTVSYTKVNSDVMAQKSIPMESKASIPVLVEAEGDPGPAAPMEVVPCLVKSKVSVAAMAVPIGRVVHADAEVLAQSAVSADVTGGTAVQTDANVSVVSTVSADATSAESLPVACEGVSKSVVSAEMVETNRAKPFRATVLTGSTVEVAATIILPAQMEVKTPVVSLVSCELGTAWYPPKWVNGGFWIRQSHGVTQNENGELVIK